MDLSAEEALKIRVAMGLKALDGSKGGGDESAAPTFKSKQADNSDDDPGSTLESRQAQGYDNWKKLEDERKQKEERAARNEKIKKEREKAQRFALLSGEGLADQEDELDDKAWLKGMKKRTKAAEKDRRSQEERERKEREAEAARQYTEKDLAGIKVGHQVGDFGEGEEVIVTLKDRAIDASDDEDELEATALKEKEKLEKNLELKKRKRYDPNQESDGTILAQYDDEIDPGKRRKVFTLDGKGRTVEELALAAEKAKDPKKVAISLDILKDDDTPISDYKDISEIKIRKKKSKSKSKKKSKVTDDDDVFQAADEGEGAMEIDSAPATKKKIISDSFVDDEDLQAILASQRREALKKRKKMRPEDLARQIRDEKTASPAIMDTTEEGEEPGLVIDETREFVESLRERERAPAQERVVRRASKTPNPTADVTSPVDAEGDVEMSYANVEDDQARQESEVRSVDADIGTTGLSEEKAVDSVGATLALLRERGIVKSKGDALTEEFRQRQRFLADKHRAESKSETLARQQRETDRDSGRLAKMNQREREEHARRVNSQNDNKRARELSDIFNREYNPNVELHYTDQFGRDLDAKEAFKQLSHQFHGKGSGNLKTSKQLKKVEKEREAMAKSLLDSSEQKGFSNAQTSQSRKQKTAGVRLQ